MKQIKRGLLILSLFVMADIANATVIVDFEGVIPAGHSRAGLPIFPYSEDGFILSDVDSGSANALFSPSYVAHPTNHNGTDILGWKNGTTFQIADAAGALFSLLSFDATNLDVGGAAGEFIVTGFFGAGGSVSITFNNTLDTWSTFIPGNSWVGLSSVHIQNSNMDSGGIDNITLSRVSVPEPASLALLGLGLAGVGFLRKNKSA